MRKTIDFYRNLLQDRDGSTVVQIPESFLFLDVSTYVKKDILVENIT